MSCAFNKRAKICTCLGVLFLVPGIVVMIRAFGAGAAVFDVETLGGNRSFRMVVNGDNSGDITHGMYIRASDDCELSADLELVTPTVSVRHESSELSADLEVVCGDIRTNGLRHWEAAHDPPLRSIGSFMPAEDVSDCHADGECRRLYGTYQITCSTDCWVFDLGEHVVMSGVPTVYVLGGVAILLFIAGLVACCVACCCCCKGADKGAEPRPVEVQVIVQPGEVAKEVQPASVPQEL